MSALAKPLVPYLVECRTSCGRYEFVPVNARSRSEARRGAQAFLASNPVTVTAPGDLFVVKAYPCPHRFLIESDRWCPSCGAPADECKEAA